MKQYLLNRALLVAWFFTGTASLCLAQTSDTTKLLLVQKQGKTVKHYVAEFDGEILVRAGAGNFGGITSTDSGGFGKVDGMTGTIKSLRLEHGKPLKISGTVCEWTGLSDPQRLVVSTEKGPTFVIYDVKINPKNLDTYVGKIRISSQPRRRKK